MPTQEGYIGTIEVETRGVSRVWISLTEHVDDNDWIQIGGVRAWFTMNLESGDRPYHLAQLTLLMEAMRHGLHVQVSHEGAADFAKEHDHDSFEVNGIRILRRSMTF